MEPTPGRGAIAARVIAGRAARSPLSPPVVRVPVATEPNATKNPEDRREAARRYIEWVGGKLHGFWYAFGAYDGYNLWEAPDNVSMVAVAIAIGGGGALSKFETTPLLTVEETLDALGRARAVAYRPPGA